MSQTHEQRFVEGVASTAPDYYLRDLVCALDLALNTVGFWRSPVWMLSPVDDDGKKPWDGVAGWARATNHSAAQFTMNGISLFANGTLHVSTDAAGVFSFAASTDLPAVLVARAVAAYVRVSDEYSATVRLPLEN